MDTGEINIFGHGFSDELRNYSWDETLTAFSSVDGSAVETVLRKAEQNKKSLTPE